MPLLKIDRIISFSSEDSVIKNTLIPIYFELRHFLGSSS